MSYLTFTLRLIEKLRPFLQKDIVTPKLHNTFTILNLYFSKRLDGILCWGHQRPSKIAKIISFFSRIPVIIIEDGFIVSNTPNYDSPYSLAIDHSSIYYDAREASDLEQLINNPNSLTPEILDQARQAIQFKNSHHISKYNYYQKHEKALPDNQRERILILDQVKDDLSVKYGLASEHSFQVMIEAAKENHPNADIYLRYHPSTKHRKHKRGYIEHGDYDLEGLHILDSDNNPIELIEQFDSVYTVSSQLGFEALLLGCKVYTFGMPFYAGWGCTEDYLKCPRRIVEHTIEELFAIAYILYPTYVHPVTQEPSTIFEIMELIAQGK